MLCAYFDSLYEELYEFRLAHFVFALILIGTHYFYLGILFYVVNTNLPRYPYSVAICGNLIYLVLTGALLPAFYGCVVDCTYLYEYHIHEWIMILFGAVCWSYSSFLIKAEQTFI